MKGQEEPNARRSSHQPPGPPQRRPAASWESVADARELRSNAHPPRGSTARPGQHARHMARARETARRRQDTPGPSALETMRAGAISPTHRADLPPQRSRRSRTVVGASGLAALLLAVGGTTLLLQRDDDSAASPDQPGTSAGAPGTSAGTPGTATATPSSTAPPAAGAATDTLIRSRLSSGDDVITDERIRGTDISLLRLSVPTGSGDTTLSFSPQIDELEITADGQRVINAPTQLAAGDTLLVPLSSPADTVLLHFRARGLVERTAASVPGRALVLLNGLHVTTTPAATPVTVRVDDRRVLNLACDMVSGLLPCGRQLGRDWQVRLPEEAGEAAVVAQMDLR